MKRHLILFFTLCLMTSITSCSIIEKKKIEKSALGYLDAINKDDFAEAYKYSDNDTKKLIDILEEVYKSSNPDTVERTINNVNISILNVEVTSDSTANVEYRAHQDNVLIDDNVLTMKKVGNQWLVHQTKESCTSALLHDGAE
ncbi:MAG: DUF4878 domain-containing protein [Bacteroidales bacterium]|nr:DUF4878 domain-containing protein [Bacteroidales bacterium]